MEHIKGISLILRDYRPCERLTYGRPEDVCQYRPSLQEVILEHARQDFEKGWRTLVFYCDKRESRLLVDEGFRVSGRSRTSPNP